MLISIKYIAKGRVTHTCAQCQRPLKNDKVEMYGMAHYQEKPYTAYVCRQHLVNSPNSQIQAALQEAAL